MHGITVKNRIKRQEEAISALFTMTIVKEIVRKIYEQACAVHVRKKDI
jgi:hypothetical protein